MQSREGVAGPLVLILHDIANANLCDKLKSM